MRGVTSEMVALRVMLFVSTFVYINGQSDTTLQLTGAASIKELKQLLALQSNPETFTSLSIQNSRLETLEPKLFERFVSLKELNINDNELLRISNDDFYGLKKLRTLTLTNNGIEQIGTEVFHNLENLDTLDLSYNLIAELHENLFQGLKWLRFLRATNNLITNLPKGLLNQFYINKITFDFRNNRIETIPQSLVTNITGSDLIFTTNAISKIEAGAFQHSTFLSLHLDYNALTTINPDVFKNLVVYNELRLTKNKIVLQPENFRHLKGLMRLFLDENEISVLPSKCFEGLKNVNTISLRNNRITSFESDSFAGLPNLRVLFLGVNPIKTLEADSFKHVPTLVFLHIDSCLLGAVVPEAFRNVGEVSVLNLGKNRITSLPPTTLYAYVPKVKNLYLDNNQIETLGQGAFKSTKQLNLQYLLLKRNRIKEIQPGAFDGISQVYSLQLQQNLVKRLQKDAFRNLMFVNVLNLEDNDIEDVHDLKQLPPSKVVLLGGNERLEQSDLPLNELELHHVDFISFKNFSYHRVGKEWRLVDKPVEP